jgi:DNA-binding NarL/FixJ family response regulator
MPSGTILSDSARVLVVDDNEAVLSRAAMVLAADCVVVGTVRNGPAALAAARALRPDVIVLDIGMPGMNGFEVASYLRDTGSTAAVVFLTVHVEEEFIQAAQACGAIGYVVKPRLWSDLLFAVREALAGRSFVSALA